MPVAVLVHGAWHNGECWRYVRALLEQNGWDVHTPSLPLTADATLESYIEQVTGIFTQHDLYEVVLVGHSYGGAIVSGLVARIPERIHHTIFLDGFIPRYGQSVSDTVMPSGAVQILRLLARAQPMWPVLISARGFGIHDPEQAHWLDAQLQPHPAKTVLEPFPYAPQFHPAACTYIACTQPMSLTDGSSAVGKLIAPVLKTNPLARFAKQARAWGWRVQELDSGHDAMVTMPEQVAAFVQRVAPLEQARAVGV